MEKTSENHPKKNTIIKSGFLSKRSGEEWNKKWFELRQEVLIYYSSKKNNVKGEISLHGCSIELQNDAEKKFYSFVIKYPNSSRRYHLSASTEEDLNSWIKVLNKCMNEIDKLEAHKPTRKHSKSKKKEKKAEKEENVSTRDNLTRNKKIELPHDLNTYSKEQLIELIAILQEESEVQNQEINSFKQRTSEVMNSLKSQLVQIHSQNKQIQKEILLKDANIRKVQLKIVEANQRVVDSIPFQESTLGRTRAHTLMKMLSDTGMDLPA